MFAKSWTGVLLVGVAAMIAIQVVAMTRIWRLEAQIANVSVDQAKNREWVATEVNRARAAVSGETTKSLKHMEALRAEVNEAKDKATEVVATAQTAALKTTKDLESRLEQAQRERAAQLGGQIADLKEAANQTGSKLNEVTGEVGNVRNDVASAKADLNQTVAELRKMMGDMGVMSGLIATNSKQINALRALGERDYLEFSLTRGSQPTPVGGVGLVLKKTDPSRNRYTLELWVEDRKIEKRDKTRNEPVQFYLSNTRQPLEIVVNDIGKDRVVGYVSAPRLQASR
jgi:DNA repair exonuclease SbcCD ATPase subunit